MSGQKWVNSLFGVLLIAGLFFVLCPKTWAQTNEPKESNQFLDMPLDQLVNVEITSSARRPQSISRASRAVYVITAEDIRQAGPVRIEDLLRQVPGMEVFQTGGLTSALGCRGYTKWNNERMQILLDGRAMYDPYLGGALFYLNPIFLEDIERIEVIRGSAGVAWGVNAINGVINIITKKAADTQGIMVTGSVGNRELQQGYTQIGGTNGPLDWRATIGGFHDNGFGRDDGDIDVGEPDYYDAAQGTARADLKLKDDATLTFTGGGQNAYNNKESLQYTNLVWDKKIDPDNSVQIRWSESFIARDKMSNYYTGSNDWLFNSVDVRSREDVLEIQHTAKLNGHTIVWGADYTRDVYKSHLRDEMSNTTPENYTNNHASAFIEDEITLADNLWFTPGFRGYYDEITHYDWAASSALVWEFSQNHFLRGSASRAFRRPTMFQDFRSAAPGANNYPIQGEGNDSLDNEHMVSYEIGYRGQLQKNLHLNVEGYLNKDTDMLAKRKAQVEYYQPWLPGSDWTETNWYDQWDNVYSVTTYGVETSFDWKPTDWWMIRGFHDYLHQTKRDQLTNWRTGETGIMLSPEHRVGLTNRFNLDSSTTLNTQLYWTDTATTSYEYIKGKPSWKFDIRLARRFWNNQAELAIGAMNLFEHYHYEGGSNWDGSEYYEVPRIFYAQFFYKF
jgi:iron complex outermembrane receptor protein